MYAIFETGGKQYKVEPGDIIYVEKLDAETDDAVRFETVMALGSDDGLKVGAPYIDKAAVEATIVKNGKGKKIRVFTYRSKKGSKRCLGHRQPYTKLQITSIAGA